MHVAYPLPMLEGEDVHQALVRFEGEWHREARRIGLYDRSREFQEAERIRTTRPPVNPLLVPIVRARKRPKPRSHELQGAIVLPGLEEWIKPGAKAW